MHLKIKRVSTFGGWLLVTIGKVLLSLPWRYSQSKYWFQHLVQLCSGGIWSETCYSKRITQTSSSFFSPKILFPPKTHYQQKNKEQTKANEQLGFITCYLDPFQVESRISKTKIYLCSNATIETICSLPWSLDLDTQGQPPLQTERRKSFQSLASLGCSLLGG